MELPRNVEKKLENVLFVPSTRKNKKYMATIKKTGQKVHFGDKRYEQYKDQIGHYSYLDHLDPERRKYYRARHSKILDGDGNIAYKVPYSPAWFSYYMLW